MATLRKVIAFAKRNGYSDAEYQGSWNGFDVYQPVTFADRSPAFTGPPLKIFVEGNNIRMSTVKEAFAYLRSLPPDYDEDED